MKKGILKVCLTLFVTGLTVACNQEFGNEDNPVDTLIIPENPPENFSVSGCKSSGTRDTRDLFTDETVEYEAREGDFLRITHNNAIFACHVMQIYAEMSVDGNTYIIEENAQEYPISADCICRYDLGYDIGPLSEGKEYTVSIRRGKSEESEFVRFAFTFSPTIKGQISAK